MSVVAHGIYTYANRFAPFVYDVVSHHQKYKPVIFSYGVGVHGIYRKYTVYAPNAIDDKVMSSNPNRFRRVSQSVGKVLSAMGLRQWVLRTLRKRGRGGLEAAVKKEGVQVLHAHFGSTAVKFLPLCQTFNLPLIVSTYGYDLTSLPLRDAKYRQDLKEVFAYASFVLSMSNDMRSRLIELGCPNEKAIIHHTSIDVNEFAYREPCVNEKIRILTICNYVEKKGLPYLLRAFAVLRDKFPNVELRIIGRPQEENATSRKVDNLIQELDLGSAVHQEHFVPFSQLPQEFAQADIFALPSVTATNGDQEGIPTVLVEAQSVGVPVVSSWHAGIPDAVLDGETGFLVEERDVDHLAERLGQLVSSRDLRIEMGKRGRAHIEQEFNIYRQVERLEKFYDQIIDVAL